MLYAYHRNVFQIHEDKDSAASQEKDCRFGFKDGKLILLTEGVSVKNAKAVRCVLVTARWKSTVNEPVWTSKRTTEKLQLLQQEIERAEEARKQSRIDGVCLFLSAKMTTTDDFVIRVRRGSTHLNSYNWIRLKLQGQIWTLKVS